MNGDIILDVKNISKTFYVNQSAGDSFKETILSAFRAGRDRSHPFVALNNITFQLKRGESLGIIGKNGAGKSTLLKILAGIMQPDEGEINFYGKTVSILDIGAGFHPELTGRENVFLSASLYGFSRKEAEDNFDEIVEFSGIGDFINEQVKNYSAGMYLRLAFSIITCLDADIYLIDEVINVGDAAFQAKCKARMEELVSLGKTLLIITHNLNEVSDLCNRIILMEKGQVIEQGGLDVIQKYIGMALPQFYTFDETHAYHVKSVTGPLANIPQLNLKKIDIENYRMINGGISNKQPFSLVVDLELNEDIKVDVVMRFYSGTGLMLFITTTFQKGLTSIYTKGAYHLVFTVPDNLLNKGVYSIDLLFINDARSVFNNMGNEHTSALFQKLDKVVTLKVEDEKPADTEAKFAVDYPGILKPMIKVQVNGL